MGTAQGRSGRQRLLLVTRARRARLRSNTHVVQHDMSSFSLIALDAFAFGILFIVPIVLLNRRYHQHRSGLSESELREEDEFVKDEGRIY
jgi:hypothetical protein